MRPVLLTLVAAVLLGCGDRASVEDGGRAPGDILTVYALASADPTKRDFIRGAKLALAERNGRVGRFTVQFASKALPEDTNGAAEAVEEVVRDIATIAVVESPETGSAPVTAPLLNAVGILHVAPGPGVAAVAQPAARRTFFAVTPAAGVPPGFAPAFPGAPTGPLVRAGYDAMRGVLAALDAAGDRAPVRSAVVDAFAASF